MVSRWDQEDEAQEQRWQLPFLTRPSRAARTRGCHEARLAGSEVAPAERQSSKVYRRCSRPVRRIGGGQGVELAKIETRFSVVQLNLPLIEIKQEGILPGVDDAVERARRAIHHGSGRYFGDPPINGDLARAFGDHHELFLGVLMRSVWRQAGLEPEAPGGHGGHLLGGAAKIDGQIAERLVLSHRTVQNHVQNTLNKLQLHNRVDLVRYAIEHGLDTGGS